MCSSEGQQSYEVKGQTCSSFSTALTMALRGEGTYMQVLENVQKSKKLVSMFEILFLRNNNLFTCIYMYV